MLTGPGSQGTEGCVWSCEAIHWFPRTRGAPRWTAVGTVLGSRGLVARERQSPQLESDW